MKRLNIFIILLLAYTNSIAISSEKLGILFSDASRLVKIDYHLLMSIGYASSKLNPYYIGVDKINLYPNNYKSFINIINDGGWIFNMRTNITDETIIIKNKLEIIDYIEKFGKSRNYSITNIDKSNIRFGIMGIDYLSTKNKKNISENINKGSFKLKELINKFGLENALSLYCECHDPDRFIKDAAFYYNNVSGKRIQDLFRKK